MNLPARCILIDDDPLNNMIAKKMLSMITPESEIVVFQDPNKALTYLQYELPIYTKLTAVFLDISMPVMDGFEVLQRLEASGAGHLSHVHIFMLSSTMNHQDIQRARNSPIVVQFVEKPLSIDLLRRCFEYM